MPEQPSPMADTRKPCPNCRYFIGDTSINYSPSLLAASLEAIFAAGQECLRRTAMQSARGYATLRLAQAGG
jgi:hypothetical protein